LFVCEEVKREENKISLFFMRMQTWARGVLSCEATRGNEKRTHYCRKYPSFSLSLFLFEE
jgi:hypothetical protein